MEKEMILEKLREVTKYEDVRWELRYFHVSVQQVINEEVSKVLDEISSSDDVIKKLKEKVTERILKKIELISLYKEINKHPE
jgi:hypothetical protein